MNKYQLEGQLRALLLAIGSMLCVWGLSDGKQWLPVIGVVMAAWSFTWGWLHHRDPLKPGTVSWSLLRKLLNACGAAAVAYGWLHPDKVDSVMKFLPLLGPLLAARYSWISNIEDDDNPPSPAGTPGT